MNKCQNPECGKEIPEGKKYCGTECLKKHLQIKKQAKEVPQTQNQANSNPFWTKGEGSINRDHNISEVKRMILSSMSYGEIRKKAMRYFTSKKFNEYFEIASDEIKGETET